MRQSAGYVSAAGLARLAAASLGALALALAYAAPAEAAGPVAEYRVSSPGGVSAPFGDWEFARADTLAPGQLVPVVLTALDSAGAPVPGATVYLQFGSPLDPARRGSVTVEGQPLPAFAVAAAHTTDAAGQIEIAYRAPAGPLPYKQFPSHYWDNAESIRALDVTTGTATVGVRAGYLFGRAAASWTLAPRPIAQRDSLGPGQQVAVTAPVTNAGGVLLTGVPIRLAMFRQRDLGQFATVNGVVLGHGSFDDQYKEFTTDSDGRVTILYHAPTEQNVDNADCIDLKVGFVLVTASCYEQTGPPSALIAVTPRIAALGSPTAWTGRAISGTDLVSWELDLGDGSPPRSGACPPGCRVEIAHVYADPGSYTAWFTVVDARGRTGRSGTTAHVRGYPTAVATADPSLVGCGDTLVFDGSGSSDPVGRIVAYEWDLDYDGSSFEADASGATVEHAYAKLGRYTAALRVSSDFSLRSIATVAVDATLRNEAPVAVPGGPYVLLPDGPLSIDGGGSFDPNAGCDGLSYEWDLDGDGAFDDASGAAPVLDGDAAAALGLAPGTNAIALRVTDRLGLEHVAESSVTVFTGSPIARLAAGPNPVACGEPVSFDGSASHPASPERPLTGHAWDFGDGTGAEGERVVHAYDRFGTYDVVLTVTDGASPPGSDTVSRSVVVSLGNEAPLADAGGPYEVDLGAGVVLSAAASTDPNEACGDSIAYAWDLDDDGDFGDATGPTAPVLADALGVGEHAVAVRVTDTFGVSATSRASVRVYDNRPFAAATASPTPAACGQPVGFSGGSSHHGHPGRTIVDYAWDFGDGESGAGESVDHAYARFGTYRVTLEVADDNVPPKVSTASVEVSVSLGNRPPLADAGGPYRALVDEGDLVLDGTESSDPDASCGDAVESYEWDLDGDGEFDDASGSTAILGPGDRSELGLGEGDHLVRLRATDTFGLADVAEALVTVVANRPPVADAGGPYAGGEGGTVTLRGGGSDPDADPLSIAWDLDGDGEFEVPGGDATLSLADTDGPATLSVTLRACDDKGACDEDVASVAVANVAPSVTSVTGPSEPVLVGTAATVVAAYADPGTADTHTATIDWGDGSTSSATTSEGEARGGHVYSAAGLYRVTVTVADDDGGETTAAYEHVAVAAPFERGRGAVRGAGTVALAGGSAGLTVSLAAGPDGAPRGTLRIRLPGRGGMLRATAFDWLVVFGDRAIVRGSGTLAGRPGYGFLLSVADGPDRLRLRITGPSGDVVVDTQPGAPDDAAPTRPLRGGNLVVR